VLREGEKLIEKGSVIISCGSIPMPIDVALELAAYGLNSLLLTPRPRAAALGWHGGTRSAVNHQRCGANTGVMMPPIAELCSRQFVWVSAWGGHGNAGDNFEPTGNRV
jgi:hypothetical protein